MPTAQDVLSRKPIDVATITEDTTVVDAAKLMSERRIGALVVMRAEEVAGMFSERDVLNRVVAKCIDPCTVLVKDVMTSPVACCHPNTKLAECSTVMTEKRIRHLPVIDGGKLVGIISVGDIVALEHGEQQRTIEYLHAYLHEGTR